MSSLRSSRSAAAAVVRDSMPFCGAVGLAAQVFVGQLTGARLVVAAELRVASVVGHLAVGRAGCDTGVARQKEKF